MARPWVAPPGAALPGHEVSTFLRLEHLPAVPGWANMNIFYDSVLARTQFSRTINVPRMGYEMR